MHRRSEATPEREQEPPAARQEELYGHAFDEGPKEDPFVHAAAGLDDLSAAAAAAAAATSLSEPLAAVLVVPMNRRIHHRLMLLQLLRLVLLLKLLRHLLQLLLLLQSPPVHCSIVAAPTYLAFLRLTSPVEHPR